MAEHTGSLPTGSVVLTESELARMLSMAHFDDLLSSATLKRKADRKENSDNRVKNWNNTLDALRRKKEENRNKRLEEAEAAHQKLDREEEKIRAENRKAIIKHAEQLLYEETDRVKSFNSKLLLSDVMRERESQKTIIERRAKLLLRQKKEFEKQQLVELKKLDAIEEKKVEDRLRQAKETAQMQQDQLLEFRGRQKVVEEARIIEGEKLKKQAQDDVVEAKSAVVRLHEKAERAQVEQREWNKKFAQRKKQEALLEAEEDARIKKFADEKDKIVTKRKKDNEDRQAKKQAIRQKLIDDQVESLRVLKDDEDSRVAQQVEERLQREANQEEKKQRFIELNIKSIDQSRKFQRDRKARELAQEKREELERQDKLRQELREQANDEKNKRDRKKREELEIQDFLRRQMLEKQQAEEDYNKEMRQFAQNEERTNQQDMDKFGKLARERREMWGSKGRSTKPMDEFLNANTNRLSVLGSVC